jgi:hypothetical protein
MKYVEMMKSKEVKRDEMIKSSGKGTNHDTTPYHIKFNLWSFDKNVF